MIRIHLWSRDYWVYSNITDVSRISVDFTIKILKLQFSSRFFDAKKQSCARRYLFCGKKNFVEKPFYYTQISLILLYKSDKDERSFDLLEGAFFDSSNKEVKRFVCLWKIQKVLDHGTLPRSFVEKCQDSKSARKSGRIETFFWLKIWRNWHNLYWRRRLVPWVKNFRYKVTMFVCLFYW